jgi:amylosucrase/maltose alpha-D-glucosyltransferase/alpha-amylase
LNTEILDTKNPHVFGYLRQNETEKVIVLANFSEKIQEVILEKAFRMYEINFLKNIDKGEVVKTKNLVLEPYDLQFFSIG